MDKYDNKIFEKFMDIAKRLLLIQEETIKQLDLTYGYYKVLSFLLVGKSLNQTCLSEVCGIDKPATSRLINKMYENNLITKELKNNNKKNIYISLTDEGKLKAEEIKNIITKAREKYFKPLSQDDKQMFLELLNKSLKEI